jgi:hypothetical protein
VVEAAVATQNPATAAWLSQGLATNAAVQLGDAPESQASLAVSSALPHVGVLTNTSEYRTWRTTPGEGNTFVPLARSARFFGYLDARSEHGLGEAAWLALSLAATRTRYGANRWEAEPDLMDVLWATVKGDANSLARLVDDFAQDSFFRAKENEAELALSWSLKSESLPRSIALADPLEPSGSTYVLVELQPEHRERVVAFRLNCEAPVSYVWSVVRLLPDFSRHSSVPVAYRERGGQADVRVTPQPSVSALLLVGTNMGGIDLAHPFDPDHGPHEAHGCQIYVSFI